MFNNVLWIEYCNVSDVNDVVFVKQIKKKKKKKYCIVLCCNLHYQGIASCMQRGTPYIWLTQKQRTFTPIAWKY